MSRSRADEPAPDRLAAVLEELEAVRRAPGWVPTQDTLLDEPPSRVAALPRRIAEVGRGTDVSSTRRGRRDGESVRARHRSTGESEEVRPHEPLLRTPSSMRDPQVAPSRLAVIGAVVLVVVAAAIFGGRALLAKAIAAPHPVAAASQLPSASPSGSRSAPGAAFGGAASGNASGNPGTAGSSGSSSPSVTTMVVVQVVGQVRKPGVVEVRQGSRVRDVLEAAGGALPSADLAAVNLARVAIDGEQIQVPKPGEQLTRAPGAASGAGAAGGGGTASGPPGGTGGAVIDINAADAAALDELPGVGPVIAQRIVDWRQQNGRFSSVDELGEVSGIGEKMLEKLRPAVRVG